MVSKALANRLKLFLSLIIGETQSAFVSNRLITDNALLAFEAFHYMKNKRQGVVGHFVLKLDMMKAYDRVEWHFLRCLLQRLGFSLDWIRCIMSCLESVSFSFKFNDGVHGMVYPTMELRQGCSLSAYLFIICVEALSSLLNKAVQTKQLHGLSVSRGGLILSHLLFVDDCLLFARTTTKECSVLIDILSSYERASGQKVNMLKFEICFSKNVNSQRR